MAQMRHHLGQGQAAVKIGTAQTNATIAQNVSGTVNRPRPFGRDADQGDVRGAAADIDDQHDLFSRHPRLILHGRRDGFELKGNVLEPHRRRNLGQRGFGRLIGRRITIDEMHRATQNDPVNARRVFLKNVAHVSDEF